MDKDLQYNLKQTSLSVREMIIEWRVMVDVL